MAFKPRHASLFTGLNLYLEKEGDGFSVTLEGDAIKEEYEGPSEQDASAIFESILAHYKWREEHDPPNPDGTKTEYRQYPARPLNA